MCTYDFILTFILTYRITVISTASISTVLSEPSVSKTDDDMDLTVNSESLPNSLQTVPPVGSVPATAIVDDVSNMSLSSVNLHSKVINIDTNFIIMFLK